MKKTKTSEPPLLIVDGNHLAHRCRHTFSLSFNGTDVSVTYGFLKVLQSYIRRFQPYAVAICWDGGVPEFRRWLIPEYKANRHQDEDELAWEDFKRQVNELHTYALPMMGIFSIMVRGAEADDLIYHFSRISTRPNIVISGDKDLLQTINSLTQVYHPGKDKLYNAEELEQDFGVELHNFVHWRAIQGDNSDNIKGVPGIGDKTATKLFQQFGSLSAITNAAAGINPAGRLDGKLGQNINTFGLDRIARNVKVMVLFRDKTGARMSILRALDGYCTYNPKRAKLYLLSRGFVSLMDLLAELNSLTRPEINRDARYPLVQVWARTPLE